MLRLPVAMHLLHVFTYLEEYFESAEKAEEFISNLISDLLSQRKSIHACTKMIKNEITLTCTKEEEKSIIEGLMYMFYFARDEIRSVLPNVDMRKFQCASFVRPYSVCITFFTDGQEHNKWRHTLLA